MTNQPAKRRTSPLIVWPVCLFILFVLYLASYGPALWLYTNNKIPSGTCDRMYKAVYSPLFWIAENTRFFEDNFLGRAFDAYAEWWIIDSL